MKQSNTRLISKDIKRSGQDVVYTELYEVVLGGAAHKIKVYIKSDAYENQSHSSIFRWSGVTWEVVHRLNTKNTRHGLAYRRDGQDEVNFVADRNELVRVAHEVLQ